ncbi:hypothetical protein ACFV2H_39955 [Streptomyces sp. NPDC059629]|uniref:hypothetical protein n=1 Tax=Streptomyces sp. NPDC059629 TaxID=3346889 RepID=UPI0036B3A8F4
MEKPQLLVFDYPGRRDTKHVSDMRLEDHGFDVRYAMKSELPDELYAESYARALVRNSGVEPSLVAGVIGYCMAGHLAQEAVAQLTTVRGTAPPLILLDSGPCPAQAVEEECRTAFAAFGGDEAIAVLDADSGDLLFSTDALRNDPLRTIEEVRKILRSFAMDMMADDGASIEEIQDSAEVFIEHYVGWITHLIAAHNNVAPGWNGDVLHIVSRDHPFKGDWPGAAATKSVVVDSVGNDPASEAATRDSILAHIRQTSLAR